MRLVVANPPPVRLDGPIAAPGRVAAMPAIGRCLSAPISRQDRSGQHKHNASNERAPARAGPVRSLLACA